MKILSHSIRLLLVVGMAVMMIHGGAFAEPVTIVWWGTHDSPAIDEMVKRFNGRHLNIRIVHEPTGLGWVGHREALMVASAAGVGPDIVRVKEAWIPDLVEDGMLYPLSGFFERDRDKIAPEPHYYAQLLKYANTYQGILYGMPFHNFWPMLNYNQNLLDEAGLPGPPDTWDEFRHYANRLTRDIDDDGQIDQWGSRLYTYDRLEPTLILFSHLVYALPMGATIRGEWKDGRPAYNFNTPENLRALSWNIDNIYGYRNTAGPADSRSEWDNQVALWFTGQFSFGAYNRNLDSWRVALIPKGETRKTFTEGNSTVMMSYTAFPKEAWEVLKYLNSHEADLLWARYQGLMPFRDGNWYEEPFVSEEHYIISRQQILEHPILFPRYHRGYESTMAAAARAFRDAFRFDINPRAALEQADEAVEVELRKHFN